MSAAAYASSHKRQNTHDRERGLGGSKPYRNEDGDSDWESASEDETETETSSDDDIRSELAYGAGASALGAAAVAAAASRNRRVTTKPPEDIRAPDRRPSVVDPRMFGPMNSLRGYVNTPCGFGDADGPPRNLNKEYYNGEYQASSVSNERTPMQTVYAVPTSDPNRFDVDRGSEVSSRQDFPRMSRPGPVPLQQPIPITPVSSKVYETAEPEESESRRSRKSRGSRDGSSFAQAAVAGAAVGAIGAAVMSSRSDKKDRKSDKDEEYKRDDTRRRKAREKSRYESHDTIHEEDETHDTKGKGKGKESSRDSKPYDPRGTQPRLMPIW